MYIVIFIMAFFSSEVVAQSGIAIDKIVSEESGSVVIKNPFLDREDLVIWKTKVGNSVEIPEEFRKEYLEVAKYIGRGSVHGKRITFIDKGRALIGNNEKAVNDTIEVIEWLDDKENFVNKSTISPNILNHFLLYHELSHSITERSKNDGGLVGVSGYGYDFDSTLYAEIFADLNAVKTISNLNIYDDDEILSLVEYLIIMRTYRFSCCFDIFHYSGKEMGEVRADLIKKRMRVRREL